MAYAQRSTFTFSEDDSLPTLPSMHEDRRRGRLPFALYRVLCWGIKAFAWLELLGLLRSVIWWLVAVGVYLILSRLLSFLLGGTRFSLGLTLLVVLRSFGRMIVRGLILGWQLWPRFTLKQPWSFLALGLWGVGLLYAWTLLLLGWDS